MKNTKQKIGQPVSNPDLQMINRKIEIMLRINRNKHTDIIYEMGLAFIEFRFRHLKNRIPQYSNSSVFWEWWNNQWKVRNYELLLQFNYPIDNIPFVDVEERIILRTAFDKTHDNAFKILHISPVLRTAVVAESYSKKDNSKGNDLVNI